VSLEAQDSGIVETFRGVASGSEPVGFAHQMQGNLEASTVEFRTTSQGIHLLSCCMKKV